MNNPNKSPLRVAITGAAGQIGYQLSFRIASGQLFGPDQPVILQLIEIPPAMDALNGVAMELDDCAFDTLHGVVLTDQPEVGFKDTRYALLVGARPRTADMERKDLLMANARIFSTQGRALNAVADGDVKVLVVGNPANTNALIARCHAPDLDPRNFTAMTRLDHNRAKAQLALRSGAPCERRARRDHLGESFRDPAPRHLPMRPSRANRPPKWCRQTGTAKTSYRRSSTGARRSSGRGGASSAASAASAAIDHVRDWALGAEDAWVSMGVASDGSYGISEGVVYSHPARCPGGGRYEIVQGLEIDEFSRERMDASDAELREERGNVDGLGQVQP